jgi:hypothetical protein
MLLSTLMIWAASGGSRWIVTVTAPESATGWSFLAGVK